MQLVLTVKLLEVLRIEG